MTDVEIVLLGAMGLLGVGLYGLLIVRNMIKVVIALQILVKAALLAVIAAGKASDQINLSQSLVMTIIVADTVVAVVGLAMAVQLKRLLNTMDLKNLSNLRG